MTPSGTVERRRGRRPPRRADRLPDRHRLRDRHAPGRSRRRPPGCSRRSAGPATSSSRCSSPRRRRRERVAVFDERAERLAAALWPGPLTLVLPRSAAASGWDLGGRAAHRRRPGPAPSARPRPPRGYRSAGGHQREPVRPAAGRDLRRAPGALRRPASRCTSARRPRWTASRRPCSTSPTGPRPSCGRAR